MLLLIAITRCDWRASRHLQRFVHDDHALHMLSCLKQGHPEKPIQGCMYLVACEVWSGS